MLFGELVCLNGVDSIMVWCGRFLFFFIVKWYIVKVSRYSMNIRWNGVM